MKTIYHPASTRGKANFGWLEARYSFSFANYYDPQRLQFGLLRVFNDDIIAPAMGFGKHPHKNMEIVTIPQSGALHHQDSMGNEGIILAGEIQVMSAGSGVEHSEINAKSDENLSLFQIWIFPEKNEVTPRYDQKKIAPLLTPNAFTTVVKPKDQATENELWIHQQAYFNLGHFDTKTKTTYTLHHQSHGAYLFVIDGNATLEGQRLGKRDAMGVWQTNTFEIEVAANSQLLILEVPMN